MENWSSRCS